MEVFDLFVGQGGVGLFLIPESIAADFLEKLSPLARQQPVLVKFMVTELSDLRKNQLNALI